jgi:hypothetical protein
MIHWLAALLTTIVAAIVMWLIPALRHDAASSFSTLGVFLTLYGVLFAIIEVLRIQAAAALAAQAARDARELVQSAYSLRDASECLSCIDFALRGLDAGDSVPSAALNQITRLYAAEFQSELNDETSSQRRNIAMLQSYVNARRPGAPRSTQSLQTTLMEMSSDLAQRGQTTIAKRTVL